MGFSLVSYDVVRHELYPKIEENDILNLTQIDKQAQKVGRNAPSWKEKLEQLIQNGSGFKLEGFDPKTLYAINKIPVDVTKLVRTSTFLPMVAGVVAGNVYILSEIMAHFESNKATLTHYCSAQSSLLPVPCYAAGAYLMLCYHSVKVAPIVVPLIIGAGSQLFEDHLKSRAIKLMKVFSYFSHTNQIPGRTLPLYAACLEKGMKYASKTQSVFRRLGNFFSGRK